MEYVHGGDIYTYGDVLDFSVNVNPYGPSEEVLEAAKRSMDEVSLYQKETGREKKSAGGIFLFRKWSSGAVLFCRSCRKTRESTSSDSGFRRI